MTLQNEHRRLNLVKCNRCGEFHATDKGCNVRSEHIAPVVRLLPCPFCGGEGYLSRINKYSSEYTIACKCCAAEGGWSKTATGAEMLWNTRQ
jgi:Lar family restriction alleviation protein